MIGIHVLDDGRDFEAPSAGSGLGDSPASSRTATLARSGRGLSIVLTLLGIILLVVAASSLGSHYFGQGRAGRTLSSALPPGLGPALSPSVASPTSAPRTSERSSAPPTAAVTSPAKSPTAAPSVRALPSTPVAKPAPAASAPQAARATPVARAARVDPLVPAGKPAAPVPSGAAARTAPVGPARLGVPVTVIVGDHGVKAPVSADRLNADGSLFVPPNPRDVSWASQDVAPGSGHGTIILTSHINSDGVQGAFADLADYRPGQIISIVLADGRRMKYAVAAEPIEVDKNDVGSRRQELFDQTYSYGLPGKPKTGRLLLLSCGGLFDNRTGHYESNIFVYALPI